MGNKRSLEVAEEYVKRHRGSFRRDVSESEIKQAIKKVARALHQIKPARSAMKRTA
jgi:hypothetical protein